MASNKTPKKPKGSSERLSDSNRSKQRKTPQKVNHLEFWGDKAKIDELSRPEPPKGDARALLDSLGRPPLVGYEASAERCLALIYERAAFLAQALAVAGQTDVSSHGSDELS